MMLSIPAHLQPVGYWDDPNYVTQLLRCLSDFLDATCFPFAL